MKKKFRPSEEERPTKKELEELGKEYEEMADEYDEVDKLTSRISAETFPGFKKPRMKRSQPK